MSDLSSEKHLLAGSTESTKNLIDLLSTLEMKLKSIAKSPPVKDGQPNELFKNKYNGKYYYEPITQQNMQEYLKSLENEKNNNAPLPNWSRPDTLSVKISDFSQNVQKSATPNKRQTAKLTTKSPLSQHKPA